MSTALPTHCSKSNCGTEINGYDHACSNQHLQYSIGKTAVVLLLATTLLAIHLFRVSGDIWPMYLLASMGFVHAFAIGFSRGRALGPSAGYVAVVVSGWLLWELLEWSTFRNLAISEPFWKLKVWMTGNPIPVVLFVLIVSTVWMFLLGNATALEGLHETARIYLPVGTFILGAFGACGLLIELGDLPIWLSQAAMVVTVLAPLAFVLTQSQIITSPDGKLLAVSFWTALIYVYLSAARPLVNLVNYFITELIPAVVGKPAVQKLDDFWVLRYSDWMTQIALVLQVFALLSLVAASLSRAIEKFQWHAPEWYSSWKEQNRAESSNPIASILRAPVEWIMGLANLSTNLALLIVEFVKSLVINTVTMLKQIPKLLLQLLQFLVIPVATFAGIGLAFIIVLRDLRLYLLQFQEGDRISSILDANSTSVLSSLYEARTMWGESVTVVLFALLVGTITFLITNPRFRNEGLTVVCVIVLGYLSVTALASILSFTVSSMSGRVTLPFSFEPYGDLLRINMILVVIFVLAILLAVVPTVAGSILNRESASSTMKVSTFLVILPLLGFVGYAVMYGIGPIYTAVRNAV